MAQTWTISAMTDRASKRHGSGKYEVPSSKRGLPSQRCRLRRVEEAETILLSEGFRHVRVRDHGDIARIEVAPEEFARLNQPALRSSISARLRQAGFRFVCVDLEGYRR